MKMRENKEKPPFNQIVRGSDLFLQGAASLGHTIETDPGMPFDAMLLEIDSLPYAVNAIPALATAMRFHRAGGKVFTYIGDGLFAENRVFMERFVDDYVYYVNRIVKTEDQLRGRGREAIDDAREFAQICLYAGVPNCIIHTHFWGKPEAFEPLVGCKPMCWDPTGLAPEYPLSKLTSARQEAWIDPGVRIRSRWANIGTQWPKIRLTQLKEQELFERYQQSYGVLVYRHAVPEVGWWRHRVVQGFRAGAFVAMPNNERIYMSIPYSSTPRQFEQATPEYREEIAVHQSSWFFSGSSTSSTAIAQIDNILHTNL
jgi:hypothetical protein